MGLSDHSAPCRAPIARRECRLDCEIPGAGSAGLWGVGGRNIRAAKMSELHLAAASNLRGASAWDCTPIWMRKLPARPSLTAKTKMICVRSLEPVLAANGALGTRRTPGLVNLPGKVLPGPMSDPTRLQTAQLGCTQVCKTTSQGSPTCADSLPCASVAASFQLADGV